MRAVDIFVANPEYRVADVAKALGKHYNTVYAWTHSECFQEELDKRLKEEWKDSARRAKAKMEELVNSSKDEVALNASKFILECTGFKPKEQIEVSSDTGINININYGNE